MTSTPGSRTWWGSTPPRPVLSAENPDRDEAGLQEVTQAMAVSADLWILVSYFREPGRAEAEIEPDARGRLPGFCAAPSSDAVPAQVEPDPRVAQRPVVAGLVRTALGLRPFGPATVSAAPERRPWCRRP